MQNNNYNSREELQTRPIVAPPIAPPPAVIEEQQAQQAQQIRQNTVAVPNLTANTPYPQNISQNVPQGNQYTPSPVQNQVYTVQPNRQYTTQQNGYQTQYTENQPPQVYYPRNGSGLPPLMPPPQPIPGDSFSVASLVLGVISLTLLGGIIALVASILALIFGILGRKRSQQATGKANKLATAGFIMALIAIPLNSLYFVCGICTGCTSSLLSTLTGSEDIYY